MPRKRKISLLNFLVLVIFVTSNVVALSELTSTIACKSEEYQCNSGQCIPIGYLCNGIIDCTTRDDELNCDIRKCTDEQKFFKCRDGGCISRKLICDDQADCKDYSDESDELCETLGVAIHSVRTCDESKEFECSPSVCIPIQDKCDGIKQCINGKDEDKEMCKYSNITCPGFLCDNGICLSSHAFVCDGINDCEDGSDESHCTPDCELSDSKFMCKSKDECIDLNKTCNDEKNCHDGSDEGEYCKKNATELCKDLKCDGKCIVLPDGPTCLCKKGFFFNTDSKVCEDINECERYGTCSQQCVNTPGSHYCTCAKGFRLSIDNKTCDSTSINVQLIYSSKRFIKKISLNTNFHEFLQESRRPVGVAFDGEYYYWTEVSSGREAIMKMHVDKFEKETIFTKGLELPEDLAVDWLTKNIYFTDSSHNHIAVCTNDGYHCTELVQSPEMQKVRAIALHPTESLLYWSDWGEKAHIGVSYMDGSQARVLITDVKWPNGIALDWPNGRIYWIDALYTQIESATIHGKDRRVILKDVFKHPFSIAVFGNRLYWSDKGTKAIEYCDKFTGKNHDVLTQGYDIFDVFIYDEFSMPQKNHACKSNPCSHICLLSANNSFTCACPVNMQLKPNNFDCVISPSSYNIILGISDFITSVPYKVFGRDTPQEAFKIKGKVDRIEYNTEKGTIFIADNTLRLITEYNLITKASQDLVVKDISHVTSMSYDYIGNNLFWCDKVKSTIEVFSLNTKKHAIIQHYTGTYNLAAISLIPSQGEMFVALQSKDHSHIDRQSMLGDLVEDGHHHVIEEGLGTSGSFHLAVDEEEKKVYWSDSRRRNIEYSNFDGTMRKYVYKSSSKSPSSLAIIGDDIYWSSEGSRSIMYRKKDTSNQLKTFRIPLPDGSDYDKSSSIFVASGSPQKSSSNPCRFNNGGCSDICIANGPNSRVCKCASGYSFLNDKNVSCVPHQICDFRCKSSNVCIEASKKCDGKADCSDKSDETDGCNDKSCRLDQFKCNDGQCIEGHFKCDGNFNCKDKSDEVNCDFKCSEFQIKCPNEQTCLNITQLCDKKKDCADNFDEEKDVCQMQCPLSYFKCISGQCIPKDFECNFRIDCEDGSDEHDQCKEYICDASMKPCRNGFCISKSLFCDGHQDCDDNYDELNCDESTTCDASEFQCISEPNRCIDNDKKCDNVKDCLGGEDEKDCPLCPAHLFECDNGECIPNELVCNANTDCADRSDEKNCGEKLEAPEVCSAYRCSNGKCLDYSQVCNNIKDCDDDEGVKCNTTCTETPCQQKCQPTPRGAICSCNEGFKLKSSADHECEDFNECLQSPCSQICENTIGSYKCLCHDGYVSLNGKSQCKALGTDPVQLFFTKNQDILVRTEHSLNKIIEGNETIIDFAIDLHRRKIIFVYASMNGILSVDMNTLEMSVDENVPIPYKILYDWVTGNIYIFSRNGYKNVELHTCNMQVKTCVLLRKFGLQELIKSADIDPINRWLFYVKQTLSFYNRNDDKICKIRLDGSEVVEITKETEISAITLDIDSKQIFYVSKFSQALQSINYDGDDKKTYLHQSKLIRLPVDVAVFESYAYIIDQYQKQLIRCKLYDDKECDTMQNLNIGSSMRLIMAHTMKQKKIVNKCEDNGCEEICIVTDTAKKCLCNESGRTVTCEEIIKSENTSSLTIWFWIFMIILTIVIGISIYVYRRRGFHTNFNISMYFRNNDNIHELINDNRKISSPNRTNYPTVPPSIVGTLDKGYEVTNNNYPRSNYHSIDQMQNFSDEETMADNEFDTNDINQKLIV